jgi:hypothetical protein
VKNIKNLQYCRAFAQHLNHFSKLPHLSEGMERYRCGFILDISPISSAFSEHSFSQYINLLWNRQTIMEGWDCGLRNVRCELMIEVWDVIVSTEVTMKSQNHLKTHCGDPVAKPNIIKDYGWTVWSSVHLSHTIWKESKCLRYQRLTHISMKLIPTIWNCCESVETCSIERFNMHFESMGMDLLGQQRKHRLKICFQFVLRNCLSLKQIMRVNERHGFDQSDASHQPDWKIFFMMILYRNSSHQRTIDVIPWRFVWNRKWIR